jgi:hypothetical protein
MTAICAAGVPAFPLVESALQANAPSRFAQMIISFAHNFIFIKTKKTAGSSMEIALSSHAGPDDVVTSLGFDQDTQRHQLYPDVLPRNFSSDKALENAFVQALKEGNKRTMRTILREDMKTSQALSVRRHAGANVAKEIAGAPFWEKAFKFTIERHPYEKVVSLAWFRAGNEGDFEKALNEVLRIGYYRNFDLYALNGMPVVDFIIRYEHFDEDVPKVEQAIGGLPILARLPRANSHQRKDRRPAHQVLSEEQKAVVQNTCREEFELLGYDT